MTDYRAKIYENYETKFNRIIDDVDENSLISLYEHYDVKLFPFLKEYDSNTKILELGCGPGYLIKYLKQKGFNNLTGIDISKEQIELAKKNGYNVFHSDVIEYLRQNSEKYNIFFALDFIEHFTKDELFEMFRLIHTDMLEGGLLIIRTPNADGLFPNRIIYGDLTHQTIFNQNSLSQILNYSGFTKQTFFENSPVPKNLKGIVRTILWKIIKLPFKIIRIVETGAAESLWTQDIYCVVKK